METEDGSAVKRPDDAVFDCLIQQVKQWMDDPQKRREFEQWQKERWAK